MTLAQTLALWADKLRDVSALGLRFSDNIYEREHFQAVQDIAMQIFGLSTGHLPEEIEPLRTTHFARPSPLTTADAAIVDETGRILLIQRADSGRWAMPGGILAVGETPAEGAVREAFEETGVRCEPLALAAVHDSRLCGSTAPFQLLHFTFLCRPLDGGRAAEPPSHANEILGMDWFAEDALPAELHGGHRVRIPEAYRVWRGDSRPFFDAARAEGL